MWSGPLVVRDELTVMMEEAWVQTGVGCLEVVVDEGLFGGWRRRGIGVERSTTEGRGW